MSIVTPATEPTRASALLDRFREETRAEHLAIETALGLMGDDLSVDAYRRVLQRFYGYYEPVEARLNAGAAAAATHVRHRAVLLKCDLVAVGGGPDAARLPLCTRLPELATAAQRWGCLYVLEGASVGGQVIRRHLERRLRFTPAHGGRFFHGDGERTGSRWREFRSALTDAVRSPAEADDAVSAASSTFRSLHEWWMGSAASEPHTTAAK